MITFDNVRILDHIEKIHSLNGIIYLWFCPELTAAKGSAKRKIEIEQVGQLIEALKIEDKIQYKESGAPYLPKYIYTSISISHSDGYFAVYISNVPAGVDIQVYKGRLIEGQHYFLSSAEQGRFNTVQDLQVIWGAKEAFYKQLEGNVQDLKNEVAITEINYESGKIVLEFQDDSFELSFNLTKDYCLVYTMDKE